jgi:predicted nucleic acid-binding protein
MRPDRVFVDTGGWLAVQLPEDTHHHAAIATFPALIAQCRALVTSNHVVGETYTFLRRGKGYAAARRFLDGLLATSKLERHFVGEALEREAYQILHRYAEHPFTFVDGTSFALMRHQRIRFAFAFDTHFATAGFVRIPLDFSLTL